MTKLNKDLKRYIAGSEAYSSSKTFRVLEDDLPNLPFLENKFGFYAHLLSSAYDMLKDEDIYNAEDFKSICKGLSYFINEDINGFEGKYEVLNNSMIAFLGQDYTTSKILAEKLDVAKFDGLEQFILCLLKKELNVENSYLKVFVEYLLEGKEDEIKSLLDSLLSNVEAKNFQDPEEFFFTLLAGRTLSEVLSRNVRNILSGVLGDQDLYNYVKYVLDSGNGFYILYPSQIEAIEKGILNSKGTISLQTPTSSGKTAICELIAYKNKYNEGGRTLFLVPFRALASELRSGMGERLKGLGLNVLTLYGGGFVDKDDPSEYENVDLLIVTPEKFVALMNSNKGMLDLFNVVICDEGHLLETHNRGLDYELIITAFKTLDIENKKIIYSSAIIPNIEEIQLWLEGAPEKIVKSNYRAAELKFSFLNPFYIKRKVRSKKTKSGFKFQNVLTGYQLEVNPTKGFPDKFYVKNVLSLDDNKELSPKTHKPVKYGLSSSIKVSSRIALKSLNLGKVAIFTTQKTTLKKIATELEYQSENLVRVNKPWEHANIHCLTDFSLYLEQFVGTDFDMVRFSKKGILYHNGDLLQPIREKIEEIIRNGDCSLLVCTSTLAEGVNLPVDTLVLQTVRRFNPSTDGWEYISKRDIKNIVGRAGRAAFSNTGLVISGNIEEFTKLREVIKEEEIEPIESFFKLVVDAIYKYCEKNNITIKELIKTVDDNDLQEWVNSIDQILINALDEHLQLNPEKVRMLYEKSFAYMKSSAPQQEMIKELFEARSETIIEVGDDLKFIIDSNLSLRILKTFREKIKVDEYAVRLLGCESSFDSLEVIFEILEICDLFNEPLASFNSYNKCNLELNSIKKATISWMAGYSIQQIGVELSVEIDVAMRLISRLVFFDLNILVGKLSRFLEKESYIHFDSEDILLDFVTLSGHIERGTSNMIHYNLNTLSLNDRICIHTLGDILVEDYEVTSDTLVSTIKSRLKENSDNIIQDCENKLNPVSQTTLIEWIESL